MSDIQLDPVPEGALPPTESVFPPANNKAETPPAYIPVPPPSRFKQFLRSATRWLMVVLIAFLVGVAVMAYPLLRAQASLKDVEKERDQAKFTLAVQSKLLANLQGNQERLVVMRALSELRAARLALAIDDEVDLPLYIDKAAQVMKTAPATLMETQQATVAKIQQKITLAQEKAKSNLAVTKPELDQLLEETIENLRNLDALLNPTP